MAGGRPAKYRPEYCEKLIEHMTKGLSFEAFAGVLGVTKQTLYNWAEENPQFLDSKKIGTEKARLWWEAKAIDYLVNTEESTRDSEGNMQVKKTSLNSTVWIFNMKNRFKEDWRDRQEVEGEITVNRVIKPTAPGEETDEA